ncbi:MAG: DNA repair protein RadC [Pseudohongiellaceae bacterium]
MPIIDWPVAERPREKLLSKGAVSLSDAELVAILLQTGIAGKSALDLAGDLLRQFRNLAGLMAASRVQLSAQPGLGASRIALLEAMKELLLRQMQQSILGKDILTNSAATREYLRARFRFCEHEVFSVLYLTNQHHLVHMEELFTGTIDGAAVYPREVVKRCLHHNAAAVIFAHNHPSGIAEPSQADIAITGKLRSALGTIEVRVLDHLVIGTDSVVSMAERDLL